LRTSGKYRPTWSAGEIPFSIALRAAVLDVPRGVEKNEAHPRRSKSAPVHTTRHSPTSKCARPGIIRPGCRNLRCGPIGSANIFRRSLLCHNRLVFAEFSNSPVNLNSGVCSYQPTESKPREQNMKQPPLTKWSSQNRSNMQHNPSRVRRPSRQNPKSTPAVTEVQTVKKSPLLQRDFCRLFGAG